MNPTMETMLEATSRLREAAFEFDLSAVETGRLRCGACGDVSDANILSLVHTVRFEGESDPADEQILVALVMSCGHAGLFSTAYGPAIDGAAINVLRALSTSGPRPVMCLGQGRMPLRLSPAIRP